MLHCAVPDLDLQCSTISHKKDARLIWAELRENLSFGCPTKQVSNQSPQLQRLARRL